MIEPPFLRRVRVKNPHKLKPTPVIMSAVISKLLVDKQYNTYGSLGFVVQGTKRSYNLHALDTSCSIIMRPFSNVP